MTGAVVMNFPFYWMLSSSGHTRKDTGLAERVLLPQKIQLANWVAAWTLGSQGTGGSLSGGFTGGWQPGGKLEFKVEVAENEPGAGLEVVVPRPTGVLSFPLAEPTATTVEPLHISGEGSTYLWTVEPTGDTEFTRLRLPLA